MAGDAYSERTFIMVKPDGVQRGLVGKIIKRFEEKGFKLVALKFMWVCAYIILYFIGITFNYSILWYLEWELT